MTDATPLLELSGATVRFGDFAALDDVSFRMFPGEVHSLMGENGAGKSTLIKCIAGALPLATGTLTIAGEEMHFSSPVDAQGAGVGTVFQELDLLPNVSVAENISLGREAHRFGFVDRRAMNEKAREVLNELGVDIDPSSRLGSHPLAIQQMVAIARAISTDVRVLVLDEPTSSLDQDEVAELFRVIRELKDRGVAILFVSHFLDQVYEICDRITVLRDGLLVGEYLTPELLRIDLVHKLLGRDPSALNARKRVPEAAMGDAPILSARGVTARDRISDADVDLFEGDVLGVAGLLGSGRTELARLLTGVDEPTAGSITLDTGHKRLGSPNRAVALGVVYSSENRRTEGVVAGLTVLDNIALGIQAQRGAFRRMSAEHRRELALSWIEALDIRPADPDRLAGTLSSGNQQKVLLARLLATSPRVLVLDEPTRGIDVGARVEIHNLVNELADNGLAVMFISAELEEVVRVADRVAVLRDGLILETVDARDIDVDALLALVAQSQPLDED